MGKGTDISRRKKRPPTAVGRRATQTHGDDADPPATSVDTEMIDMTGRPCRRCRRGTYQEVGPFDDRDGHLHCPACMLLVDHYEPVGTR
jgi:hypothetical protein